jgi:hypothetical protein
MDLTTKKFTITLPTLIGILSAISTIIAGYWYFKNTIETTKSSVVSANENYKELKSEIQILREQLYEVAIMYNKNVHIENELHNDRKYKRRNVTNFYDEDIRTSVKPLQFNGLRRDTIDINKMKIKNTIQRKK